MVNDRSPHMEQELGWLKGTAGRINCLFYLAN